MSDKPSFTATRPINRSHRRLIEGLGLVVSRWAYVEWIEGDFLAYLLGSEPKTVNVMTVKLERIELMRTELVTLADLQVLLAEITDIYRELAAFGDMIGFHPRGKRAVGKRKGKQSAFGPP